MSTVPARISCTIVGSPFGPVPSLCLRTGVASIPLRRSTCAVPCVASSSKPRSASTLMGKTIARLSRLATETKIRPEVGSPHRAPIWVLANAGPKVSAMPMTSPVERISGPSTESTTRPSAVRNRLNGRIASLTETGASMGSSPPSPRAGSMPSARSCAIVAPSMIREAALASGTPVALATNGTVREARGLASST